MSFLDELIKEGEAAQKGMDKEKGADVDFRYFKDGKNKYRILPSKDGKLFKTVKHFGVGFGIIIPNTDKGGVWTCSMLKYGSCPMCKEFVVQNGIDRKKAWRKMAATSYWFYVLDEEGKPAILNLSAKEFVDLQQFMKKCKEDKDFGNIDITSLENGSYIIVEKEKKDKRWVYNFSRPAVTHSITEKEVNKLFDGYPEFSKLTKDYTPEQLQMVLDGDFSFMKKQEKELEPEEEATDFNPKKYDNETKTTVKATTTDNDDLAKSYGLE